MTQPLSGWAGQRRATRARHHEPWGEGRLPEGGPVLVLRQTVEALAAGRVPADVSTLARVTHKEGAP